MICSFFGCISLWKLHEDDIYWIIRAGDDMLRNFSFLNTETWSFTISGQAWANYHWLSQVLLRIIYAIGQEPALVISRGLCIGLFFYFIQSIILNESKSASTKANILLIILLTPVIYISMIFRFHLRPDFFCLLVFTFFIMVESKRAQLDRLKFPWWWFFCLCLSSQWHAGVSVYLGFTLSIIIFFSIFQKGSHYRDYKNWIILSKYAAITAISYFANPSHFKIFKFLWLHANYDQNLVLSTEFLSFNLGFLDVTAHGWPFVMWFFYLVLGWIAFIYIRINNKRISYIYANYGATLIIGLVFSLLSLKYIRMIPFHLIFFLPMISYLGKNLIANYPQPKYIIAILAIFVWTLPLQSEIRKYKHLWGIEVNAEHFPVNEVEFIKKIKPEGQIFSDFLAGSYQTWALQEYPVFIDHRDVIYNDIKPLYLGFLNSPEVNQHVAKKFHINSAIIPIIQNQWDQNGKLIRGLSYVMPSEQWALIFFGNKYAVFIKKIPEHKLIVEQYQYQYLNPTYPIQIVSIRSKKDKKIKDKIADEVKRCLVDSPHNIYCIAIRSEFLMNENKDDEAIKLLEKSRDIDPKKNTDILIQLWKAYTKTGQDKQALAIDQLLERRFSK